MIQRLSVIIPTYQRMRSLQGLLELLAVQTLREREILLVDQNAPGRLTAELPDRLLSPCRVIRQEEPNVAAARNRGFEASSGELLLFLDDDLRPEPDFCARGVAALRARQEIGCLSALVHGQEGLETARRRIRRQSRLSADETVRPIRETLTAALFFRRDFFRLSGGFDEALFRYARAGEDREFFMRLRRRGMRAWADTELTLRHEDTAPGGCRLREISYWENRRRCVRSWVFRARSHRAGAPLTLTDWGGLAHESFLNRWILSAGPARVAKEALLLIRCVRDYDRYLAAGGPRPAGALAANFLKGSV